MNEAEAMSILYGILIGLAVYFAIEAIRLRWRKIARKRYGGDKL